MKIVKYPHPALRQAAQPVTAIDKDIQAAAMGMLDLMYAHEGLGLAAPQVSLPVRLIVMNFEGDPEKKESEFVAINPVIVESKGTVNDREGCLSFPGLYQNVRRAKTVKVQAYNLKGELYEMLCHDLPARVWQHEIDHLDGVLFIDHISALKRNMILRKLLKARKEKERDQADEKTDKAKAEAAAV
jgi:peptide deformylase